MTPDNVLAQYRQAFGPIGSQGPGATCDVVIRRFSGSASPRAHVDAMARARVTGYQPVQLVGSIVQGDKKAIVLNDPSAAVPSGYVSLSSILPVLKTDKLVVRGKELAIEAVDDDTRRFGDTLIALELQVRG